MFCVYFALPSFTITFNLSPPPSSFRWGENSLSKTSVCEFTRSYTTRMEERWIWTRANSSTIRPQLKYWLWRILIQKYYVCFSLTFASTHEAKNFLSRFNKRTFSFHFCVELEFFSNRWNEISHWATRTPFYFNWFSWYFLIYFFFHCNSLNIKYAGNHQLKSLRSYACEKREERTANWSIN